MVHKFDPANLAVLDNPRRKNLMPPEELLQKTGLAPAGAILADVGCGNGYFAIPAALMVGPTGMVYAVDIAPEALAAVRYRASAQGIPNLIPLRSQESVLPLPDLGVDGVLMVHVVHELAHPAAYLREVHRVLAPGGKVLVVEWCEQRTDWGPPEAERIAQDQLEVMLRQAHLYPVEEFNLAGEFYVVLAKKLPNESIEQGG